METAISRLERVISNLDQTVNSVYKSWDDRNTALTDEIIEVGKEIRLQESTASAYLAKANKVDFSEYDVNYAKLIREGGTKASDITDEELQKKIKEYEEWYNKYLDCIDAAKKLRETEAELYAQRFDNVLDKYDGILQGFDHTESMLNEYISQAEVKGHVVSKKYYEALYDNALDKQGKLEDERRELLDKRQDYYDEMVILGWTDSQIHDSEQWQVMCADIDDTTQSIEKLNTEMIEAKNNIRDVDFEVFELAQERISDVIAEADFLIDLMSYDKLHDDDGKLTDKGMATMGLHGQNYNTYMYQADDYAKQVAELDEQISKDPYDDKLISRRRDYIELQREAILNAEQEKEAIKDLVEEGINLELDALQELIDKKNEELESEKDLYDYQKKVKEQTEEIASLEKQMAAYSGDNSEEARAKVQELKVSLEEAKTNLEETEYDKYLSDTQQMLDALYEEYELTLNTRLDDVRGLVSQVIEGVNVAAGALGTEGTITTALGADGAIATALGTNATTIKTTLENEAKSVGATLSTAMSDVWNAEGSGNKVITMYGEGFQQQQTTTNIVLNSIKASIDKMVDDVDKDATTKVTANKTQTSAKADPTKDSNQSNQGTNKGSSKREITDETLMGIASAIWIYGKYSGWGNNPFRENKLTDKIGATNAKKVQDYINKHGASGKLYEFYINKNKSIDQYKYNAFASGAKNIDETQLAWTQEKGQEYIIRPSDGAILTPIAKGDSVLNAQASNNIFDMANSPADFIKDNLNFGTTNVPNNSTVSNSYTQHIDNVVFRMDNIKNYEEMLYALKDDKRFEKLVTAMTIDRVAGKSSLAKNKSIR